MAGGHGQKHKRAPDSADRFQVVSLCALVPQTRFNFRFQSIGRGWGCCGSMCAACPLPLPRVRVYTIRAQ
eukprot:scaffold2248_cov133-Isochrysis_galbana.AAC.7